MSCLLEPRLDVLPPPQRRLWQELSEIPRAFTLYGGTAIALHLGHRESVDFDFFSFESFDTGILLEKIAFLDASSILQSEANTLTLLVDRDGPVQVSFFGVPRLGQVRPHIQCQRAEIKTASLIDLAGTKAAVVQRRAEAKDYVDLDALIQSGSADLATALSAARVLYGATFNPQLTLKALSFFGDGNLDSVPPDTQKRLQAAVTEIDLDTLPSLDAIRSHGEHEA